MEAQDMKSRNIARRMISSDEDAKKITGFVRRLSSSIQTFTVRTVRV